MADREWPVTYRDMMMITRAMTAARVDGFDPDEVIISADRADQTFIAFGTPVRLGGGLDIDEGLLVQQGRPPRTFNFGGGV